jgi:hypothetical protein
MDTFEGLNRTLGQVKQLEHGTAGDVHDLIYQTQVATNQVLGRVLPQGDPVYYGFQTRDVLLMPDQNPTDIEIIGFNLRDNTLGKNPRIVVDDQEIPAEFVTYRDDRVGVQLPDALKDRLSFADAPCNPRRTFRVQMTVYYREQRGYWPLRWHSEAQREFNGRALAGAQRYEVQPFLTGVKSGSEEQAVSFSASGGYVAVDCEAWGNGQAQFTAPDSAYEVQCHCSWDGGDNLTNQECNCPVSGTVATGTGRIRGLNRQCGPFNICNCPGGGHATFNIAGSYKIRRPTSQALTDQPGELVILTAKGGQMTVPGDDSVKINTLKIRIARKGCPTPLDEVTINAPDDANQIVSQPSKNGLFTASLQRRQVSIAGTSDRVDQ